MKVAVMGAGAVGCYYGGMLARAGHEVVLIGRQPHVDAIRDNGLCLETREFTESLKLVAGADASLVGGSELVLCCVKSGDTETAASLMAPYLANDTQILSLQNGVDNAQRLTARLKQSVLPTIVYVAAEMAGPGHVRHHGRGELVIGDSPDVGKLVDLFASAGIPVQLSDNLCGAQWDKLIINCVFNALSAIPQLPYGVLAQGAEVNMVMRDLLTECCAVARAEGVRISANLWDTVQGIVQTMPTQRSSTAQDLMRGKPSEIEYLNGFVLRRGEALGVPTPVNRVLYALVRLMEARC